MYSSFCDGLECASHLSQRQTSGRDSLLCEKYYKKIQCTHDNRISRRDCFCALALWRACLLHSSRLCCGIAGLAEVLMRTERAGEQLEPCEDTRLSTLLAVYPQQTSHHSQERPDGTQTWEQSVHVCLGVISPWLVWNWFFWEMAEHFFNHHRGHYFWCVTMFYASL